MRIAVDAMGGDFAPHHAVAGAVEALKDARDPFDVVLVGPEAIVRNELREAGSIGSRCQVIDASQIIDMHDRALVGLKQKRDSSISVGISLHKDGQADAFVSAGHSGAVLSTATLLMGRIEGISRPTIGAFIPSVNGVTLLLDAGANVDCKPQHLYEFAVMGSIYTSRLLHVESPTIGLLNIGEEKSKGTDAVQEAYGLLERSSLHFVGNVEGGDILGGKSQVVICDGFVGNILLKFAESIPGFFKDRMKRIAKGSIRARMAALFARGSLRSALRDLDYEEYGGVPVLGVNGVVIIGHGKSTPKAIKNMIFRAIEMARSNINHYIQEALSGQT